MRYMFSLFFIFSIGFSVLAIASERKAAEILCERTNKKLQFDCIIYLTGKNSGKPIRSAVFTLGADMPSMPGAHNVEPVNVKPLKSPGKYSALIQLEMFGEWNLKLNFVKPNRDRLVKKLYFSNKGGN